MSDIKSQVSEINVRTGRLEQRMEMTFEAVGKISEDVTESRQEHERHELLLGEIAKTLLEQAARSRHIKPV
jgi:hypothetical protein